MAFDAKKGYEYRVAAQKDGFIDDGNAYTDIGAGLKNKHTDIPISPSGILKLHIKNVHPYDNQDYIEIHINSIPSFIGMKINTIIYGIMQGNLYNSLSYAYIKNNIRSPLIDKSIFIKEHDTTNYEILY